ncbi:MAG: universal stress protein [Halobacteriales archaeon]|nr:universal stress protein [Halobacteriales archaeon]
MYQRILVPTDGSDSATSAMEEAIALAEQFDAEVHVLHVIDDWRYDTTIESAVIPLREEAETYVERCVATATEAGVAVQSEIELGRPARSILEYVDANDVDLVVMGTRGRAGLPKRLLGSVTDYVVTHADVPVHVMPAAD